MTRHGLPQFPPAAPPLRPTPEFVSSVVNSAANLPHNDNPHQHSHLIQRQGGQIPSHPAAPTAGRDFATLGSKQKYP